MPGWQQLKHVLTRPAGSSADGRRLGLGLTAALDAQRRETDEAVADIEQFLHDKHTGKPDATDEQGVTGKGEETTVS